MAGRGHSAELHGRGGRIRTAEVLLLFSGPDRGVQGARRRLDVSGQPLLPPLVLGAGVDHHGAIGRPVEHDLALRDFISRRRTMLGWLRVSEDTDGLPGVVRHGLGDEPPALGIGGGEAGDEEGVAQGGQVVFGHQGRISNRDGGAGRHPVLPQERRDGGQEGIVDGFI
jgi:hypothetical protein